MDFFSFNGKSDPENTLIIDPLPDLKWATYFGGTLEEQGYSIKVDASGNILVTGFTRSTAGVATSGAFQTTYAGSNDIFLAKYNSAGSLLWATYFGGSGFENGNAYGSVIPDNGGGLALDANGNAFITGFTTSTSGIASTGAYQSASGGSYDIFVAKFGNTGARQWSTFLGGSGIDMGYGIATDPSGNAFVTGRTQSASGIATTGAYQTSLTAGSFDVFVSKFNTSGALVWSTYYGGSGEDIGKDISTDPSGNIVFAGYTASTTGISTSGAYQASIGGGSYDAFVAKLNSSGSGLVWATYFGGALADYAQGSATDAAGNVYITGYTLSTSGVATTGAYQTTLGGTTDGYIAKFNSAGVIQWATYFGGALYDLGRCMTTDAGGNVLVTGYTASTSGVATTGAYKTTYGGGTYDAFICKFSSTGAIRWSTYFGGSLIEYGLGITTDLSGNIFICGESTSTSGVTTTGAYQTANAGDFDTYIGKIQDLVGQNNAGINRLTAPSTYLCAGNQDVKVEIINAGLNAINTLDIRWSVDGIMQTPVSITSSLPAGISRVVTLGNINFPINTTRTIKAWTYMPNGVADTVRLNDTVIGQRRPGLNGTYTIGGTTPDYNTFTAAVSDLNNYGICGPVIFSVRPGTYNEYFTINQLKGTSITNTINFLGAGKGITILTYAGTNTTNMSTVLLNGADQLIFRNMTIMNTGATYGTAIWLSGSSDSNRFVNLAIGVDTTTTSANVNAIVSSGSTVASTTDGNTGSYCLFDSLTINGGYQGIRLNGLNTTNIYVLQNTITHCIFTNQYQCNLYLRSQSFPKVAFNVLKAPRYATSYGFYLEYSANVEINNNYIWANDCGMYTSYVNRYLVNSTFDSRIFNNMILSTSGYALYCNQSSLLKILHNSFSSFPAVSVLRFDGNVTTTLVNNHIQNRGNVVSRYVLQADNISNFTAMNYNNYYSGSNLLLIATIDYGNLPVLQAAFPSFNQNSYNQDPLFFSLTDLHTSVNLSGIYMGIDEDIDGDFRNLVSPVLGADEVNIPNNAGISTLLSPVPAFCAGVQQVRVKIGNYGINQIDSVWVNWKLNGVLQTPVKIKSTIGIRGFYDVYLGTITFSVGEAKIIKVWTSLPNGVVDPLPKNDTLLITVKTGLNGRYTIGGTKPDFANFTDAIATLSQLGICSPVLFDVRAGTYNERLTIGQIKGASFINTITFKGAGKTSTNLSNTGTSVNDWATLLIKGTDHITFRDMTISAMGSNYGIGILITGGADSNNFINMTIQANTTSSSLNLAGIAFMTNSTNLYAAAGQPGNSNLFDSLEVSGGYYGLYLAGNSMYNSVSHSTFTDQALGGIDCNNQKYIKVIQNTISTARTTSFSSLNLTNVTNFIIRANSINISGSNGIYVQNSNVINIDTNFHSIICNNMVSNSVGYSFYYENSGLMKIHHNSFRSIGSSTSIIAAVYIKSSTGIDLRDNHIRNDNPSSYALYADYGSFDKMDYNNYYSFGNFVVVGNIYPNLTALKAGWPLFNINSLNQNPQYVSLTNLHTTAFLSGTYVGIDQDIDGEPRCPSTVSIGADDKNWGFIKPVISTNHTDFFTNYPIRFKNNITGISGITYKWYVNGMYINDSSSFQYKFGNPGTYKISLQAERCIYRDSAFISIPIVPGNKLIKLIGKNPDSLHVFDPYIEPGYSAKDYFGTNITSSVMTGNNIDTARLGTYYAWYTVQDNWGNKDSVNRKVVIIDKGAPVITLKGSDTIIVEVFHHINDPGATVTDDYDTGLTIIVDSSQVNINVVGIYQVIYSSTDHSGNTGKAIRWVKIVDTGLPVITLIGNDTVNVDVFVQYFENGAKVNDNYCTSGLLWQVDMYPPTDKLATFVLTYTATDCQGNQAKPVKRVVRVVDRKKPVINITGFQYIAIKRWSVYSDAGVSIDDNYYAEDTLQKLLKVTNNLDVNFPGIYNYCYQVTDPSGNKSLKVCRSIEVLESTSSINPGLFENLRIFPNPGNGVFTVDFGEGFKGKADIRILDLTAKVVYQATVNEQQTVFNPVFLVSGIYQLQIQYKNEIKTFKLNIIR